MDDDFTLNASANNVIMIQYMGFATLKSYAMIMCVTLSGVKGQGDKCDFETVVSLVEVLAAYYTVVILLCTQNSQALALGISTVLSEK
jgi:hypothetical protein